MLSKCVVCNGKFLDRKKIPISPHIQKERRKQLYTFCQILEVDNFDLNGVNKGWNPFCSGCEIAMTYLTHLVALKTDLEEEVIELQKKICHKMKQINETIRSIDTACGDVKAKVFHVKGPVGGVSTKKMRGRGLKGLKDEESKFKAINFKGVVRASNISTGALEEPVVVQRIKTELKHPSLTTLKDLEIAANAGVDIKPLIIPISPCASTSSISRFFTSSNSNQKKMQTMPKKSKLNSISNTTLPGINKKMPILSAVPKVGIKLSTTKRSSESMTKSTTEFSSDSDAPPVLLPVKRRPGRPKKLHRNLKSESEASMPLEVNGGQGGRRHETERLDNSKTKILNTSLPLPLRPVANSVLESFKEHSSSLNYSSKQKRNLESSSPPLNIITNNSNADTGASNEKTVVSWGSGSYLNPEASVSLTESNDHSQSTDATINTEDQDCKFMDSSGCMQDLSMNTIPIKRKRGRPSTHSPKKLIIRRIPRQIKPKIKKIKIPGRGRGRPRKHPWLVIPSLCSRGPKKIWTSSGASGANYNSYQNNAMGSGQSDGSVIATDGFENDQTRNTEFFRFESAVEMQISENDGNDLPTIGFNQIQDTEAARHSPFSTPIAVEPGLYEEEEVANIDEQQIDPLCSITNEIVYTDSRGVIYDFLKPPSPNLLEDESIPLVAQIIIENESAEFDEDGQMYAEYSDSDCMDTIPVTTVLDIKDEPLHLE